MDLCDGDDQPKRNYSCKICFELFSKNVRAPISLTCGHTFCARCIKRLSNTDGTTIVCGICRQGTNADCRNLGKNVTLIEMLEHCNLLDAEEEEGLDEATGREEENSALTEAWRGAFVTNTAYTTFVDRLADLRARVHEFLPPSRWDEFDEPLDIMRFSLSGVEALLREAGDSFVEQEEQLGQLEAKFQGAMSEFYHQQNLRFVPVRWAVSDYSDDDLNLFAIANDLYWPPDDVNNNNINSNEGGAAGAQHQQQQQQQQRQQDEEEEQNRGGGRRRHHQHHHHQHQHLQQPHSSSNSGGGGGVGGGDRRRKPRRQKRRARGGTAPAFHFAFDCERDGSGSTQFDTWGVVGADEWDQSGSHEGRSTRFF